jgi:hypothetical protein
MAARSPVQAAEASVVVLGTLSRHLSDARPVARDGHECFECTGPRQAIHAMTGCDSPKTKKPPQSAQSAIIPRLNCIQPTFIAVTIHRPATYQRPIPAKSGCGTGIGFDKSFHCLRAIDLIHQMA